MTPLMISPIVSQNSTQNISEKTISVEKILPANVHCQFGVECRSVMTARSMDSPPKIMNLESLTIRPYKRRNCECSNCQVVGGNQTVGPSGRRLHICDYKNCKKVFEDANKLASHVSSQHTGKREYSCYWPECAKTYSRKDHLNAHVRTHTGEHLKCRGCDYRARSQGDLVEHRNKCHEKRGACTCPNCLDDGPTKIVGPGNRKLHTCHYEGCTRVFNATSRLQIHLRRHTGERTYACQWQDCDKKFFRKDHLTAHVKSHTGQEYYVCDTCGYRFTWKDSLIAHVQTHEIPKEDVVQVASPVVPDFREQNCYQWQRLEQLAQIKMHLDRLLWQSTMNPLQKSAFSPAPPLGYVRCDSQKYLEYVSHVQRVEQQPESKLF